VNICLDVKLEETKCAMKGTVDGCEFLQFINASATGTTSKTYVLLKSRRLIVFPTQITLVE
jgi:hypothetical protein